MLATLDALKSGGGAPAPPAAPEAEQTEIPVDDVVKELTPEAEQSEEAADEEEVEETEVAGEVAEEPESTETESPAAAPAPKADSGSKTASSSSSSGGSLAESNVRIDVHLLDKLMNLVGELVLARNQIMQISDGTEDTALSAASQRVNLITSELQEGVMKTRMQPIRNAWSKLPRVVRDLSQSCGKRVQVKMEGADTELDKTILEAIKDPLTHIVRNSVDHGIESTEDRIAAGKSEEGTLLLRAYHEGGQVNIEITDDGGGINVDRVRAKAVEKELVTEERAAAMSDREAVQLILLPGFSTAAKVTNVSGRGVGMDVVKTNVEKIGGTLDINSTVGQGTTLRIKIPLTLAIVPALVVTCHEDRYCVPQVNLLELVRLEGDRVKNEIEILHSVPVHRLRGELLPLVYLDEELGLTPRRTDEERRAAETVNIVVLQAEDRQFGLVVDNINDTQEIVVKPLDHVLRGLSVYAGSTIMGDGTVSLILDVIGIAQQGQVLTEHASRKFIESDESNSDHSGQTESYLVVDPTEDTRAAIPLSTVARLEEIKLDDVESNGHGQVVQYRGEIMPLVSLSDYGQISSEDGNVTLVVHHSDGRNVGVVVGRIVDIVDHALTDSGDGETQIIAGRVTEIVDLAEVAARAC